MTSTTDAALANTTADCYDFWDRVFRRAGLLDYTEGFYDGDRTPLYEDAQQPQITFLLHQIACRESSRILDIGCGNGTLLEEVRRRGAIGVGITISPQQVQCCTSRGLDVRLLSYRDIGQDWNARFDAVVAPSHTNASVWTAHGRTCCLLAAVKAIPSPRGSRWTAFTASHSQRILGAPPCSHRS